MDISSAPLPVSRFTIVRLVPDTIAGEYINIGVITISPGGMVRTAFLQDWSRAEAFAGARLVNMARDILHNDVSRFHPADVEWHVQNANHTIQYASLQASLEPADALLARLAMRYLKDGE